jgi:hypothetical protein
LVAVMLAAGTAAVLVLGGSAGTPPALAAQRPAGLETVTAWCSETHESGALAISLGNQRLPCADLPLGLQLLDLSARGAQLLQLVAGQLPRLALALAAPIPGPPVNFDVLDQPADFEVRAERCGVDFCASKESCRTVHKRPDLQRLACGRVPVIVRNPREGIDMSAERPAAGGSQQAPDGDSQPVELAVPAGAGAEPTRARHTIEPTRTSMVWTMVGIGVVVLAAILVFILQNGQRARVRF